MIIVKMQFGIHNRGCPSREDTTKKGMTAMYIQFFLVSLYGWSGVGET
jgi:hypothetical protein